MKQLFRKIALSMLILFFTFATGIGTLAIAQNPVVTPFSDVDGSTLEGQAIIDLYQRGIIEGYPDGSFRPNEMVNRAQALKILFLARYGAVEELQNSGVFSDVLNDQWYTRFVMRGVQDGIISGYPDRSFRPERVVNTVEILKMTVLIFGLELNLPYSYTDLEVGWYTPYVGAGQTYKLFLDRFSQLFPSQSLTRGEVSFLVSQILKHIEGENSTLREGFEVSLSPNTSTTGIVINSSNHAVFTTVSITKDEDIDTVVLSSIRVTRFGNGAAHDFDTVWIEHDGQVITDKQPFNTDHTALLTFSPQFFITSQSPSVDLDIVADLSGSGGDNSHALGIAQPSHINSSVISIRGNFPIQGYIKKIATTDIPHITINRNDGYETPEDVAPGASNLSLGRWSMRNDGGTNLVLQQVDFLQLTSTESGGDVLDTSFVTECHLDIDGVRPGTTQNASGGVLRFQNLAHTLSGDTTTILELFCDLSPGSPPGDRIGFKLSDTEITDLEGNDNTFFFDTALPLSHFAAFRILGGGGGGLNVQRDASTPIANFLATCHDDAPVLRLKMTPRKDTIRITDLYLVTIDPITKQVIDDPSGRVRSYSLQYPNGSVTTTSSNGLIHFSLGNDSDFIVIRDSSEVVTIGVREFNIIDDARETGEILTLATIPEALPGGTVDPTNPSNFKSGTFNGVRASSVTSGVVIEPSVTGISNTMRITKTKPSFNIITPGNHLLVTGPKQEIYRFSVTAASCGDVDLGSLSFDITVNNLRLQNIALHDLGQGSNPLNSIGGGVNIADAPGSIQEIVTLQLDDLFPTNGEVVSAGMTKTYVLRADIAPATGTFGSHSTSVSLSRETFPFSVDTYQNLVGNGRIIWSDQSETPHTLANPGSPDWMTGTSFGTLPLANVTYSYVD